MATRKTYNSIDTTNTLLLVEREDGNFGGYNMNLLLDSLSPLEVQLLVCTRCNGVMNEACQVGEDQLHMCEGCIDEGDEFQPMKLSRNSVPGLKSKCPLYTRGCAWVGNLSETEEHLEVCQEFVISCTSDCGVILKRGELDTHALECKLLRVECDHCGLSILSKESEEHYEMCPDMLVECPNECSLSLKRIESQDHVEVDCPNTLVSCPFSSFGCKELVKRCELEEHQENRESKHTQLQLNYALTRIAVMEEDRKKVEQQYAEDVAELKDRLDTQEETICCLEQEKTKLSKLPRKASTNSLTGSVELIHDTKRYSSPLSSSLEDISDVVIKNIGSTTEFKSVISSWDKVVIHFFDNSSVSQSINIQYKHTSTLYPAIKFCQSNVSNDKGLYKVTGVKMSHEIQVYNEGVKVSVLKWKDQESLNEALSNFETL